MAKYIDDQFDHLESDIQKIRTRHRQYISYSNELGAKSVVDEMLWNAYDECKNPRSPGNKISIEFDENSGFITIEDNGRGIPTNILEKVYTSLNMGSNIYTGKKSDLKAEILGQNGTGTLAICGLAEHVEITSRRGGTENIAKTLIFEEGNKIKEYDEKCSANEHGMRIYYKPSKVLGKNTRIVWDMIHKQLDDLKYLNKKGIKIISEYIDKDNIRIPEEYKPLPFVEILTRNNMEKVISQKYLINIADDNITEELDGEFAKRYLDMDIAFLWTTDLNPYIDSFSNSNNTVDNGDHLDGAQEALCRFFQKVAKNALTEREKQNLDIKWDDVKSGLSLVVSLHTNYERLYTGQTKHKVVSGEIEDIIINLTINALTSYFEKNKSQLKEICDIVKTNARIRRDGEKVRTSIIKGTLDHWSAYGMKNYDPCTNRALNQYKELFIIEGLSAKGSLKKARDPRFQALLAIRGVSANVFKMTLDQIVGPKGNKEFTELVTIMGCNIGPKFDLSKLQFKKIILAADADIDGGFIISLMLSFFFKVFPEIVEDGRLYIAVPPLYRVDDKNNPFVINKEDYINRYVKEASKKYKIGYLKDGDDFVVNFLSKDDLINFLSDTSYYVNDFIQLSKHYKVNDRLLEMIYEECSLMFNENDDPNLILRRINIQNLMNRINEEFPEIAFNDYNNTIIGIADGKRQLIELSYQIIRKGIPCIVLIKKWRPHLISMVMKNVKTGTEEKTSLLGILKILNTLQPKVLHRFKGLGENSDEDIKRTIMDPNTRTLIRVNITDLENDAKIFQMLRGSSPLDALNRKTMIRNFKFTRADIDT